MSTERIDVVIADSVDASSTAKLLALAAAADKAAKSVDSTQAALNKTNAAYLNAESALNRAIAAEQRAAVAASTAATAQQRLATATAQTTSAQAQAALLIERSSVAQAQAARVVAQAAAEQAAAQQRAAIAATRSAEQAAAAQQRAAAQAVAVAAAQTRAAAQVQAAQARTIAQAQESAAAQARAAAQVQAAAQAQVTAQERAAAAAARTFAAQTQAATQVARAAAQAQTQAALTAAAQSRAAAAAQTAAAQGQAQAQALALAQARAAAQTQASAAAQVTAAQRIAAAQQRTAAATFAADAAYNRLQASGSQAAAAHARVGTAATQATIATQRLATATAQTASAQSRAELAAIRLANAKEKAAQSGNFLTNALGGVVGRLAAAYGAFQILENAFQKTQAFTELTNKLRLVAGSESDVATLTNEVLAAANRSRAGLDAFGTTFQRINSAVKQVGGSQQEAIRITEALTKTIAVSGKSSAEQASALLQVSQAFNKGKLDGDEFRTVMEVLPEFADKLTKALGLTNRAALFEASKKGKIDLDAMRKAMSLLGDEADKNLGKAIPTVDQAFTRLSNSSTVLIGRLDQALGITKLLTQGINALADATERKAVNQGPQSAAAEYEQQNKILAALDQQIAAKNALISTGKAGVAAASQLLRLEETRANVAKRVNELRPEKEDGSEIQRIQARSNLRVEVIAKEAAAAAEAAKKKDKADKDEEKRDASKRRSIAEEIQRLREKTAALDEVTELGRLNAELEAGHFKLATPAQIAEARALASTRDAEKLLIDARKERIQQAERIAQAQAQSTAALEQETRALQEANRVDRVQLDNYGALEIALAAIERARLEALADEKLFQADRIESIAGITAETAALRANAEALKEKAKLQQEKSQKDFVTQQSDVRSPTGLFANSAESEQLKLEKQKQYQAQVDQLLKDGVISEQTAANARLRINLDAQTSTIRASTDFFDNLSQLQSSKSKTAARIGKAAAIANTTIKTYESATSAYASLAGIPVIGPALGAAAAAAAIAAGIANVQAIRSQGYKTGGYTGNVGLDTPVGTVHGREFVVNADGTAKNRSLLEAINAGGEISTGSGGGGYPAIIVHNTGTPQSLSVQSVTREEIHLIARDVANDVVTTKAPNVVANNLNNPNSTVSKSMRNNLNVERKRS